MISRKTKTFSFLICILLAVIFTGLVSAQENVDNILANSPVAEDYPQEDAVIMLDQAHEELTADNNVVSTVKTRVKVFTRQGKKDYGEIKIPFSSELEEIMLNYVRTINPDGTVVKPDKEAIRVMTHPVAQNAPMYSDVKIKVISMPALEKGSIIDYSYTRTGKTLMEGELFSRWFFRGDAPIMHSRYQVTIPENRELYWKSVNGNKLEPEITTSEKKKTFTWETTDLEKIYEESSRPPLTRISPGIYFSTLQKWSDMATWYKGLLEGRLESDQDIKKKVEEITEGLTGREEKIAHIFDFVATKIRYVALEFGIGKVQPYKVTETFHNKYGDCKDQASLLVTMLREAGIESYVTLINGGQAKKTYFDGPAHLGEFNHAITAVKKKDGEGYVFLDPTCDVCNWEYLPDTDRGKKVMVINKAEGVITDTAGFDYTKSSVRTEVEATLDEKGTLNVKVNISPRGRWAYIYRSILQQYDDNRKRQIFQQVLSQYISGGALEGLEHSDPENNFKPVSFTLKYKKKSYAQQTAGMLIFKTPVTLRIPFSMTLSSVVSKTVEKRKYPVVITPAHYTDEIKISIPEGLDCRLPDNLEKENEVAALSTRFKKRDSEVIITRKLVIKKSMVRASEEYSKLKDIVDLTRETEEAQIVLQ